MNHLVICPLHVTLSPCVAMRQRFASWFLTHHTTSPLAGLRWCFDAKMTKIRPVWHSWIAVGRRTGVSKWVQVSCPPGGESTWGHVTWAHLLTPVHCGRLQLQRASVTSHILLWPYYNIWGVTGRLFKASSRHSSLWPGATTFEKLQRGYLQLPVDVVYCGQRLKYLISHRKAIYSLQSHSSFDQRLQHLKNSQRR